MSGSVIRALALILSVIGVVAHAANDIEVKSKDPASGAEVEGSIQSSKNPFTGTRTVIKKSKVKKKRADGEVGEINRTEKTKTFKNGDTKTSITEEETKR